MTPPESTPATPLLPRRRTGFRPTPKQFFAPEQLVAPEDLAREELVGDWFGEDSRSAALAHFHPQAKPVAPFVKDFLKKIQPREDRIIAAIQEKWPDLTGGDATMNRLKPIRLARNTLVLEAPDAMTMFIARNPRLQEMLLARLESELPGEVRHITLRQAGRR